MMVTLGLFIPIINIACRLLMVQIAFSTFIVIAECDF